MRILSRQPHVLSYPTTLLVLAAALLVLGCGGSSTEPAPTREATEASSSPEAGPPRSGPDDSADEPAESSEQPDEIESVLDSILNGPAPELDLPSDDSAGIPGTPNYLASDELAEIVYAAGFDPQETRVMVLPMAGLGESLLVIAVPIEINLESDEQAAADGPSFDAAFFEALLGSPAFTSANVSRLVFHLRVAGEDSMLMMTVGVSTLEALVDGSITADEALQQYRYQVVEGAAP